MAGGYYQLVKTGTVGARAKTMPKISKFRSVVRSKFYKRKSRQACTGLKSLLGQRRYVNLLYKAGFKTDLTSTYYSLSNLFRINSVYDPDVGTITPPTKNKGVEGLTELAALYSRYQVYGCNVLVTLQNQSDVPLRFVISPTNDASIYASSILASDIASRAGAKSRICGPKGSSDDKCTMAMRLSPRQIIGITKATYGQDGFSAPFTASPTIPLYIALTVGRVDDLLAGDNLSYTTDLRMVFGTLVYDVKENMDE